MSKFVDSFASKIAAMEAVARRAGMGGELKYVTGSYLGIVSPNNHCPGGGPNATAKLLQQVAAVGLCRQLLVDTHVTPSTAGNLPTVVLAQQLQHMALAAGCHGLRLAVLEENLCHNSFDRALHNGGAAAGLQSIPSLAGAATSQCFSAAAHADGCGEGHVILMPDNRSWAQPPYYASQIVYRSFLPYAVSVRASEIAAAPGTAAPGLGPSGPNTLSRPALCSAHS